MASMSPGTKLDLAELGPIDRIIDSALAEDLDGGDVTTRATVAADQTAAGMIIAKQTLVCAGGPVVARVFERVDPSVEVELMADEADVLVPGGEIVRLSGNARSILVGERTALNLLARACGVATLTAAYVEAGAGKVRIADTRKTMPGLRALDRYAVRRGGGHNHRNDLGGGVLIKENHIRAAGSIKEAVHAAREHAAHALRIQCEVTDVDELEEALGAGADAVLLDNMSDAAIAESVKIARNRAVIEASGGVTLERIPRLVELGVDVISVGALTHSAPAADVSLLFEV
jgi:nicotinate-nucleotide pyrophosphorylase (carboxylating)